MKEYLTSERLYTASVDVSRYHIALEPAHLVLARACLGVLLNLDTCINKECDKPESGDESGGQGHASAQVCCQTLDLACPGWERVITPEGCDGDSL